MSDVERLLEQYVAEHRAGGDADPLTYLQQVEGDQRKRLAMLIDAYLVRAPRQAWDSQRYRGSPAESVVEDLERSMAGVSGAWPALLPRLRERARIKRADLVARLAEALGVTDRTDKVAAYYHEMEQGRRPAAEVKDEVLEELGKIVGASAAALRRSGGALAPRSGPSEGGAVFSRKATSAHGTEESTPTGAPSPGHGARENGEWDEVDELFRGGA